MAELAELAARSPHDQKVVGSDPAGSNLVPIWFQNLIWLSWSRFFLKFKIWVHYIKIYIIWSKNTKAFTLVSKTKKDIVFALGLI